jgi:hypothetical protein
MSCMDQDAALYRQKWQRAEYDLIMVHLCANHRPQHMPYLLDADMPEPGSASLPWIVCTSLSLYADKDKNRVQTQFFTSDVQQMLDTPVLIVQHVLPLHIYACMLSRCNA